MKRSRGEKPPVEISSRSHRLRMLILIERNCGTLRRTCSRGSPVRTRLTSWPPYGAINFAFAMCGSLEDECSLCHAPRPPEYPSRGRPGTRHSLREGELYFKIQPVNFRLALSDWRHREVVFGRL